MGGSNLSSPPRDVDLHPVHYLGREEVSQAHAMGPSQSGGPASGQYVYSNYTFNKWGNNHRAGPWTQMDPPGVRIEVSKSLLWWAAVTFWVTRNYHQCRGSVWAFSLPQFTVTLVSDHWPLWGRLAERFTAYRVLSHGDPASPSIKWSWVCELT